MKMLRILILGLVLVLALTACSGNAPAKAAETWFEALATMDGTTALSLTCETYKDDVQMSGLLTGGLNMLFDGMLSDAEVDLSGIDFETVSKDGNQAIVRVSGSFVQGVMGAAIEQPIDATFVMVKEDGRWKWCGEQ